MVLMDLSTLNVKVGKLQWIYPYLLFLDARKKVEEKILICVSIIRQKHPRGRKNRRVNYEGIGFEQRDTEP